VKPFKLGCIVSSSSCAVAEHLDGQAMFAVVWLLLQMTRAHSLLQMRPLIFLVILGVCFLHLFLSALLCIALIL